MQQYAYVQKQAQKLQKLGKQIIYFSHSYLANFYRDIDTDARYWYSNSVCLYVSLSVRPTVRDTLVLYENGSTYRHSFFTIR